MKFLDLKILIQVVLFLAGACQAFGGGVQVLSKSLKDANFMIHSREVIDILHELNNNWGPDTLHTYLLRPDIRELTQDLANIPDVIPVRSTK